MNTGYAYDYVYELPSEIFLVCQNLVDVVQSFVWYLDILW